MIHRREDGKVKITRQHETPTRVGGVLGGGAGLATGLVVALFPFAAIGGGLLAATSAGGAILGAVAGHAAAGMSRNDLKELGESLDKGEAGLVVVGVMDMESRIEESMRRSEKLEKKQLKADADALERDAEGSQRPVAGAGGMDVTLLLVVAAALFAWGLVSRRLDTASVTAPIVFVVVGAAVGGVGLVDRPSAPETLLPFVEVTLVWLLFSDAARLPANELRRDAGRYVRLLAVGLPLSILLGWGLAAWFFPGLGMWLALVIGAALAPTDAALGVPVVTNPVVPSGSVSSSPSRAGSTTASPPRSSWSRSRAPHTYAGLESDEGAGRAAVELLVGALVGVAVGGAGGWLLRRARRRGFAAEEFIGIAVLALALLAYATALATHGNGFVAAFCGGLAFGACAGPRGPAGCCSSSRRAAWCRCWCGWPSGRSPCPSCWSGSTA